MKYIPLGGAGEIGASAHLLLDGDLAFLIDCGQRQSAPDNPLPDLAVMQDVLKGKKLSAILLTHSHFDHIGALPVVCQAYPGVPVYATPATCDLTRVLLFDSLKVMDMREGEVPLYDEALVKEALSRLQPVPVGSFAVLPGGAKAHFFRAGHILGAAMIGLETPAGRALFTGDFSLSGTRSVMPAALPKFSPHLVITEATYGDRHHADRKREEETLVSTIVQVIAGGGHVLVPAFAQGRAQEILYLLRLARSRQKDREKFPVFVDGLVGSVNTVYLNHINQLARFLQKRVSDGQHPFYSDSVKAIGNPAKIEREAALSGKPACFISSSGMLTGGASAYYAERLLGGEKNAILLTGYQDEESPGRKLTELADKPAGERRILLNGQETAVRCRVEKYNLSAHADQQEIFSFLTAIRPKRTLLTHGRDEARGALAAALDRRLAVLLPENGKMMEFTFGRHQKRKNAIKKATENDITAFWQKTLHVKGNREFHVDEIAEATGCDAASLQEQLKRSSLFKEVHQQIWTPLSAEEISLNDKRKEIMAGFADVAGRLVAVTFRDRQCLAYCISHDDYGINVEMPGHIGEAYINAEDIIGICGPSPGGDDWTELLYGRGETDFRQEVFDSFSRLTGLAKPRFCCLEQNSAREIYLAALKNFNLSKAGIDTETGEILLYFNFPRAVPPEVNTILVSLLRQTGWAWRFNQETNLEALKLRLAELLPEGISPAREPSVHREKSRVNLKVAPGSSADWQNIKAEFKRSTGWELEIQTENPAAQAPVVKSGGRMEINAAFSHIKNCLKAEGAEIYKTSLVNGAIRVQFITPQAAEPYLQTLDRLAEETGYGITVYQEPNASALFKKVSSIMPISKNPSLFKDRREIKITAEEPADGEIRQKIEQFFKETGYKIVL